MRKQFLLAICLLVGITGVLAEVRSSDVIIENLCKQGERCMDEAKYDSSFYFYNAALSQNGVKSTDWYAKIINGRGLYIIQQAIWTVPLQISWRLFDC